MAAMGGTWSTQVSRLGAAAAIFVGAATAAGAENLVGKPAPGTADGPRPWVVVLDPGHDPVESGALGTTGVAEVIYNDRLAARVEERLEGASNIQVERSRLCVESLTLPQRAAAIAAFNPDLVVSLHHDSVKPWLITWREADGELLPTCVEHHGFSLFAQGRGPHRGLSQRLAAAIADRYGALGLVHTTYHALPFPGENRRWLDEARGVHAGDWLYLLRTVDAPVVLVESGFVVNPADEAALRNPAHVEDLAAAIADAIEAVLGAMDKNPQRSYIPHR
jgi:N-acetylmuramoyl-L-alanine amidase